MKIAQHNFSSNVGSSLLDSVYTAPAMGLQIMQSGEGWKQIIPYKWNKESIIEYVKYLTEKCLETIPDTRFAYKKHS